MKNAIILLCFVSCLWACRSVPPAPAAASAAVRGEVPSPPPAGGGAEAPPPLVVPAPAGPETPSPEFYAALGLPPHEPLTAAERELVSDPAKYFAPREIHLLLSEEEIRQLKRERGIPEFDVGLLKQPKIVSNVACLPETCQFTEPNAFGYLIGYAHEGYTNKLFLVNPAGHVGGL